MKLPVFFVFLLCSNVLLSSAGVVPDVNPVPVSDNAGSTDAPDKEVASLGGLSDKEPEVSSDDDETIEPLVSAILDCGNIANKYQAAMCFLGKVKDLGYTGTKPKLDLIKDTSIYLITKMTTLGDFCILATQMLNIIKKRVNSLLDALLLLITKLCKDFINNELHAVTKKMYELLMATK